MSFKIAKEPVTNLFPALKILQEYHKNYNNIINLLQQVCSVKEKQINNIQQDMKIYVSLSEATVNNLHDQIEQIEAEHQVSNISNVNDQNFQEQAPRSEAKVVTSQNKKKVRKSHHKIQTRNQPERQNINQTIKKMRRTCSYKLEDEARTHLRRNPLVSQIQMQFRLLNMEKQNWRSVLYNSIKFCLCQVCNIPLRSSRNHYYLRKHYREYHKNQKPCIPTPFYNSEQIFKMLKSRIDAKELTLYKCNCMQQPCGSKQQYVKHLLNDHGGHAPPFSSHNLQNPYFGGSLQLTENKDQNQYLILEEILVSELFYCSLCKINFINQSSLYYDHLTRFHAGNAGNQSSHYLLDKRQRKFQTKNQEQPIKSKQKPEQISQKLPNTKPKKPGKVQTEQTDDPSQDQLKLLEIIGGYKGRFYCNPCQQLFSNYQEMRNHFQNVGKLQNHFHITQQFFLISFRHVNSRTISRRYFVPRNLELLDKSLQEMKFEVPLPINNYQEIERVQTMTYKQFIEYLNTRIYFTTHSNKRYYWTWIYI